MIGKKGCDKPVPIPVMLYFIIVTRLIMAAVCLCIDVCIEKRNMEITSISCISAAFILLIVAPLPMEVRAYKILAFPYPAKSHVFGMSVMAVGLADRGHKVTLFIPQTFKLNLPELKNRTEISVMRYRDTNDYDANDENFVKEMLHSGGDTLQLCSGGVSTRYVHYDHGHSTFIAIYGALLFRLHILPTTCY